MYKLETNFGNWVLKWRWTIILITLILVAAAASGGRHLAFTTNYRVFFSAENPQLKAFDALENIYTKNDNVMFVLTPADGNVFTQKKLAAVEELTHKAWQIPYSSRVDSITNFQHTEANEDDLIVRDLVSNAQNLSQPELQKVRDIALNEPLLVRRLVSDKGHVTAVNVTIQLPGKDETKEVPEVVAFVRALANEMRAKYPDLEIRLTGMVFMNNAFSEASQNDMQSLVLISFILMMLILGLLLRSITATIATLSVIIFSILTALGLSGYIGFPLTPPSATSPIIILTVAIANSVHVLVTFLHEIRQNQNKHRALVESLRVNLQPVFLASVTTAIGFLTMNFSDVPPFQHLGSMVAMGVAVSFILAVTFLPALLSILPMRVKPLADGKDTAMARLGDFVVQRRRSLIWGMGALVILLVMFIPRNELNDIYVHYFDHSVTFRVDTDYTTENLTGLYTIDYSLESSEPGGISNPGFQRDVAAFAKWYRQQPETMHVNVYTDIMSRLNKNMHGDNGDWYRLPENRDLAAQYLLLYEMSLPYGLDLNNQINIDKSATRMTVSIQTLSTNHFLEFVERAKTWQQNHTSHIKQVEASGPSVMFAHIGKRNIISMLGGTTLALVLISMILIFALRSVKIGLISMVPNLVPAAMGFGLWGLLVGEVGLALSIVTGMTLGIVVDDTVHFLSKYLRARREKNYSTQDAVRYAFTSVGRALIVTSIVLAVGFLVLSLSSFELNSSMGLLTAIVIVFALVADFLLLPPLLMKLEEKSDAQITITDTAVDPASA